MPSYFAFQPDEETKAYYNSKPKVIYHYTSPEGLQGILGEIVKLRFSRFDCLNDESEGQNIKEVYLNALDEMLKKGEITHEFYSYFYSTEIGYNTTYMIPGTEEVQGASEGKEGITVCRGVNVKSVPYICCFSCNNDSLPMWSYYTKSGRYEGYNIGFTHLTTPLSKYGFNSILDGMVVYDEKMKLHFVRNVIKEIFYNATENKVPFFYFRDVMSMGLARWAMFFKNEAFQHEEEYRIIVFIPEERQNEISEVVSNIPILFRPKNGIFIPFIELCFEKTQVNSVTIGPLIKKELSERMLKEYFRVKEYNNVEIRKSNIPIRY